MYVHEGPMILGVVATIATIGMVGRMLINTVARNLLRIKDASTPSVPPAQEQRLTQMEAEIASLRDEVGRLSAVESFYAQLHGPRAPGQQLPPTGAPGPSR